MAIFLLSLVIVTYKLAAGQLEGLEDPIGALPHCFRLIQGVGLVIAPHALRLMQSSIMLQIVGNGVVVAIQEGEVPEVLRLKELVETKKSSAQNLHMLAIDDLHTLFLKVRQCPPENDRRVRTTPTRVMDIFTDISPYMIRRSRSVGHSIYRKSFSTSFRRMTLSQ